jgi:hypothetical protein
MKPSKTFLGSTKLDWCKSSTLRTKGCLKTGKLNCGKMSQCESLKTEKIINVGPCINSSSTQAPFSSPESKTISMLMVIAVF